MRPSASRRRPSRPAVTTIVATTLLTTAATAPVSAETGARVHRDGSELGELMRAQTQACWSLPAGAAGHVVRLRFALGRDGALTGEPSVVNPSDDPAFKLIAASAVRAVKRCAPFKLPAGSYEAWRDVIINFDPQGGP